MKSALLRNLKVLDLFKAKSVSKPPENVRKLEKKGHCPEIG